jgi:DNA-binding IclR family transcriptional regulator
MVQSVDRAFAILDAVSARPAGVTAIAERVGLPKSTVARLLATLDPASLRSPAPPRRSGAS